MVVGARPNFIKVAPLHRALSKCSNVVPRIIHTGQHFDFAMSGIFFEQLELPTPDYFLGVGAGTHTQQTAAIMVEFEKVIQTEKPDLVMVVGDVNSTLACALVCAKENIPVAHIEAGLRSGDRTMPEEINRIITDSISDQLFVTEKAGVENLLKENIASERIHFVGNLMIDTLARHLPQIDQMNLIGKLGLCSGDYILMTMHRPVNVDDLAGLTRILQIIKALSAEQTIVFPMHPRTRKNILMLGLLRDFEEVKGLKMLEPQGYFEFLNLIKNSRIVLTDSGGIQEETSYLRVPCITLRETTERPVTVEEGTNYLLPDFDTHSILNKVNEINAVKLKKGQIPAFWDGNTAERIVAILREKYFNSYVCDK